MHSTYGRHEGDRMTTPRLWIGSSIFGEVAEEKIKGPYRCMAKLCESSRVRPEHETRNHPFQLAAIVSSLFHNVVLGLVPRVRGVEFIVDMLPVTGDR